MTKKYLYSVLCAILLCNVVSCTSKNMQATAPEQHIEIKSNQTVSNPPPAMRNAEIEALITKNKNKAVVLTTSKGNLTIELFPEHAPRTVDDLLKFTKEGFYNHHTFGKIKNDALYIRPEITSSISFQDETNSLKSKKGTVAIIKSGIRRDYVSRIYFSYGPREKYSDVATIIGQVTDGIDLIDKIETGDKVLDIQIIETGDQVLGSRSQ